jgi:transposase
MKLTTVGIDLAKSVFQVHGVDERGNTVLRKQLRRNQVAAFFARQEHCLIGMEACAGAHYWARELVALGHEVGWIAPQFVVAVKANGTDAADAEAIRSGDAPSMRFVPVKSVEQQTVLSLHRARAGFVKARTALANQIRGLLAEYGTCDGGHARCASGYRRCWRMASGTCRRCFDSCLSSARICVSWTARWRCWIGTSPRGTRPMKTAARGAGAGIGVLTATALVASTARRRV